MRAAISSCVLASAACLPSTLGLPCDRTENCDAGQVCVDQTCRRSGDEDGTGTGTGEPGTGSDSTQGDTTRGGDSGGGTSRGGSTTGGAGGETAGGTGTSASSGEGTSDGTGTTGGGGCVGVRGCACDAGTCGEGLECRLGYCVEPDERFVPGADPVRLGCDPEVDAVCEDNEAPEHDVRLSAFFIDLREVSQGDYEACVVGGGCDVPADEGLCAGNYDPELHDDLPVSCVTRAMALAYCTHVGRSLPTEAQWERAARDQRKHYPWGDREPECADNTATFGGCEHDRPTSAESNPMGASWVGALNMAGNVRELVSDWYSDTYYGELDELDPPALDPTGPATGPLVVARGGAYTDSLDALRVTARDQGQDIPKVQVGFRCVDGVVP